MQHKPDYTLQLKSGGEIPLLFITQAILEFSEMTGVDTYEILPTFKFNKIGKVLLAGHTTYCDYNDKPCNAALKTANGWIDDLELGINSPQLAEVAKVFMWKASGMSKEDFDKAVSVEPVEKAEKKQAENGLTWKDFKKMCFEAGLKPHEYKGNYLEDNWLYIEAHTKRERGEWERTRAIAFNVAKFGNSDPKKFPKTITKFWQFPWEDGASVAQQKGLSRAEIIRQQHAENQRIYAEALAKKQKKASNGDS